MHFYGDMLIYIFFSDGEMLQFTVSGPLSLQRRIKL